jgi:hypothetical protein
VAEDSPGMVLIGNAPVTVLSSCAMLAYKFLNACHGLKSLRERRLKISTLSELNDPFELMPYEATDRNLRTTLRTTRDELGKSYGIVSLSAGWHDPVIWAHYGDKHKGLCLGFKIPDKKCERVEYVTNRRRLNKVPSLSDARSLLYTKFRNWEYEQEIRVWATLNESDQGLYFAPFGEMFKLEKVIGGANCSLSKNEIVQALGAMADSTELIKARAGFRKYEIVRDKRGFQ